MLPFYSPKNMTAARFAGLCFSSLFLWIASLDKVHAQCANFTVELEYVTHSDCQSNGVIKVKLSGADVAQLSNPKFSLSSGSHAVPLSDNGGLFQNLPPGTYTATVLAYCNNTFQVTKNSVPITVTSSYAVPNVDVLERNPSLECLPTGSFKLHLADGKPPYKIVITSPPAGYAGSTTFTGLPAGDYMLDNLTHGSYSFYVEDACQYRIIKNDGLGVTNHSYNVQKTKDAHTCLPEGQVRVTMNNGAPPYTITVSEYPAEYAGPFSFTTSSSPHLIDDLPQGNYKFKVQDVCSAVADSFNIRIDKKPLYFSGSPSVTPTNICDADGTIRFTLPDGVPKFKAEIDRPAPLSDTTIIQSSPVFNLTGLISGEYRFLITDSCHVDTVRLTVQVNTGTLSVSNIRTDITRNCGSPNGEVSFNINNGKKPYKIEINSATGSTYSHTEPAHNGGSYARYDLPADSFALKVTDDCGVIVDTSFVIKANVFKSIKLDSVASLGCFGTGVFKIAITDGEPNYTIILTDGPTSHSGWPYPDTLATNFAGGAFNDYVLGGLTPGHYKVKVIDACLSVLEAEFTIDTLKAVQDDIPYNPFGDYLYPPVTNDNNCQIVRVPVNKLPFYTEWNNKPEDVYEVAFYISDDPAHIPSPNYAILQWRPVTRDANDFMPDTLSQTYKYMRDNGASLVAVIRLKNGGSCPVPAPMVIDTIKLHPIEGYVYSDQNACDGFRLGFSQNTNEKGLICYPYSVDLMAEDGTTLVQSLTNINSPATQYFAGKIPFGKYYLDFTDSEGTVWRDSVENRVWHSPTSISNPPGTKNLLCNSYTAMFSIIEICKPYQWKLINQSNVVIDSLTNVNDDNIEVDSLEYNHTYRLLLISKTNDSTYSQPFSFNRDILANYAINQGASICTLGTGYIQINRTGASQDRLFQPGTKIIYLSGPTVPVNDTVEIVNTGITEVFPFSLDPFTRNYDTIAPGIYTFKVIDDCALEHSLSIDFKVYSYDTLTYIASPDCERGTTVIPNTTLSYFNAGDASGSVRYTIVSGPTDVGLRIGNGGNFLLKVSGDYIIEMSTFDGSQHCPQDSFSISFKLQKVRLDLDEKKSYICGSTGYIEVQATEGSGNYTYDLYDDNVAPGHLVESNTTGIFNYGRLGETYMIYVTDNLCGRSFPDSITMIDLRDKIVSASTDVCVGHQISLSSMPVSDTYMWTGPNGFVSHAKDTIFGPATMADSGLYTITVKPKGCSILNQDVTINVYQPEEPKIDDTIIVCINTPTEQLNAIPLPGHIVQWFDKDTIALPAAPIPSRANAPDTTTYYVKQSNYINCESALRQVVFIVEQLPDTVAVAFAGDICRGQKPLVMIPDVYRDYVYRIYDSGGRLAGADTARSDTITIAGDFPLIASEIYSVEVETRHACVASQRSQVPVKVVHPPAPPVYPVLHCHNAAGVPPLRADSTAGNRLQWLDLDGRTHLNSAPTPPTNVVGTFTYSVVQIDTLLGCYGDTANVQVTIAALPDTQIDPQAPDICRRTAPHIIINTTNNLYGYTVFDRQGDTIIHTLFADGSPLDMYNPNYILQADDEVYIKVIDHNQCVSPDSAPVPITVIIPPVPEVFDTSYCLYASANPLRATPSAGYYIQWYGLDKRPLTSPPIPPTSPLDTITYMISQRHNTLHCESDTLEATVRIMPLPDTVSMVRAADICPGQYPTFRIPQTDAGYIYNVYSASGRIAATGVGNGGELLLRGDEQLFIPISYYYVEVVNLNDCASEHRSTVSVAVVNNVYIEPERIPRYEREIPYSVQLITNGVSPYEFSLRTPLPSGFDLSTQGLITGSAPRNGKIDPVPFVVQVIDAEGCIAEREYLLESDIFIPQVFTPNGDGKNDVFMKGRRLVIFDRLGIKVFEGDDGWDGTYRGGQPAPPDTYFYLLFYEDENLNTEGRKKGYITLIRRK
ncbi:MAG: gliding motility-associated C-terminal domain-containing protein [Prevotellaceae bacterium]|jgi:gliding motility-associated-like protein|nr:gliding motility-associated C-terminal domain-containing protein [Prevotellaceae bacterium]